MNIVINALSARRGGGQTYLINLLQHLDSHSVSNIYILAPDSLFLPNDDRIARIAIKWPTDNPVLRAVWEKFRLPALLRCLKADILFCPGGLINADPPPGCKTVTMFRNMIPFDPAVRALYPPGPARVRNWLLEKGMLKSMLRADRVIFISEFARGVIEERAGRKFSNAVTIPHGVNEHFRINPEKLPLRPTWLPSGEYLLYVSIFEAYKHQLEVVRAFGLLCERRPTVEFLVLAGQDNLPAAERVREEVVRLGLEKRVILAGNVPYNDLPALYAHAKINLFASSCENCPNILLEAMGAGRPLLVSNRQPMPEFGGEAARYFDPSQPESIATAVLELIDDDMLLAEMAGKVRHRSMLYDWKDTSARTWEAISSLATAKR